MSRSASRLPPGPGYITVGTAGQRLGPVVPLQPDMSWIGDPPTPERSEQYERIRERIIRESLEDIEW